MHCQSRKPGDVRLESIGLAFLTVRFHYAQLILRSGVNDDDGGGDDDDEEDETTSMTTVQKATHQTSQIQSSTYKYQTPSSLKKNRPSIIINLYLPLPQGANGDTITSHTSHISGHHRGGIGANLNDPVIQ